MDAVPLQPLDIGYRIAENGAVLRGRRGAFIHDGLLRNPQIGVVYPRLSR